MALTDATSVHDVSLNTDLYEFTMAQGYWDAGLVDMQSCFTVFFRSNPFDGGYAIACGMSQIAELVENFSFDDSTINYLASLKAPAGGAMFKPGFLDYLRAFRMHVDIWAVPEGDVVFPREPIVRVQGPLIDCQLLETALLNTVNFQTLLATKTARVVSAAQGRPVFEFGLRRAQGYDGGLSVARASYIGGAGATSNLLAGKIYNIPVFGTHAHSWVMSFPSQLDAFRAYAQSSPYNCVLLLDTYDVNLGIQDAITVAHEMEARGEHLLGVRLDSGDLAKLSKRVRQAFDQENLSYVKISVSNDLDEFTIQSLLAQHAPIDSFGVGTKLATCDPQPALGGVYKLTAIRNSSADTWTPTIKLSEMAYKRTIPGIQRILRFVDSNNNLVGDMIATECGVSNTPSHMVDVLDDLVSYKLHNTTCYELLEQIVKLGQRCKEPDSLEVARARSLDAQAHLDPAIRRFLNPQVYPVGLEPRLSELTRELVQSHAATQSSCDQTRRR